MLLYKPITNCKFQAFVKRKEVRTSNRLYVLIWKVSVLMSHTRLQVMKYSAPCARLGLSSLKHQFTVYSPDGCSVRRLHHQAIECIANGLLDGEERIQKQNRLKKRIIPNVYGGMMWPSWWNIFSSVLYKSDVSPKSTWRRLWQGGERLPKPNHCESATGLSRDVVAVSRSQDGCMEIIIRALHVKTFEKTNKKSIHFASSNKHWITIDWQVSTIKQVSTGKHEINFKTYFFVSLQYQTNLQKIIPWKWHVIEIDGCKLHMMN